MLETSVDDDVVSDYSDMELHYSYDDCLELLGGFGRFQWFTSISFILSFMTGG